ncbi:KTSC domain-containing protein [Mesorhizobium sp. B2-8-3]|uniref:KTSC domain-containing protein n=1 Tax=Mesorhizobium sp. B2-8-3 TaxID=2589905 RepID=UPI0032B229B1
MKSCGSDRQSEPLCKPARRNRAAHDELRVGSRSLHVPSTAIRNIHYDPSKRVLSVWFVPTGKRYDYEDVGPEVSRLSRRLSQKDSSSTNSCAIVSDITWSSMKARLAPKKYRNQSS